MFGDNDNETDEEQPTELVMQKGDDGAVLIWAVVNGEQVFSASPHITAVKETVTAAIQTWLSRAYRQEIDDLHDLGSNDSDRIFR